MKHSYALLLFLLAFVEVDGQTISRDTYGDQHNTATGWMQNNGQKLGNDLQLAEGLEAYGDGHGINIWLMEKSTFKLSKTEQHSMSGANDTTFCVSVKATGPTAGGVQPTAYYPAAGRNNFYYPHTGSSVQDVGSYHREVYWDAWERISMQFYTSRSGPKLALVCEPGANPSNIKLAFEGQDSLKIDIYGTLKMYVKGKWFALNQAVAYQMDSQGNMTSLPWVPTYNENNGLGFVNFNFGNYNAERPLVLQIGLPNFPAWEVPEPRNMQWCTYAGSDNSDEFMATDVDASGDVYATGYSYQANFPVGTGYQVFPPNTSEFIGSEDVVTMKFSHDSKQIQWATYHGGSAVPQNLSDEWRGMDKAYDLVAYNGPISELQYVFVTGTTASVDFPTIARSQTPFANADEISFAAGLNGDEHAAFVLAYTESNGRLDWSTTLGTTPGQIWVADGLGVDIDEAGTLIWAGRVSRTSPGRPGTFPYPYVTPTGAFTRPDGGGFFVLFDSDYQIIWNTFFGSAGAEGGVHDVKIARIGEERKAFLTGVTSVPSPPSVVGLDVYQPPGSIGFFQAQHGGGMRDGYLAVLNLENYQLDFSTYWGGNGRDFGIALEVVTLLPHGDKQVWVGGGVQEHGSG